MTDGVDLEQLFKDSVAKASAGDWGGASEGFSQVYDGTSGKRKASAAFNMGVCWLKQGNSEGAMNWIGEWLASSESRGDPQRPMALETFFEAWRANTALEASFFSE